MISQPITVDLLRGLAELEDTGRGLLPHRLPKAARAQTDDPQLLSAESQPSGVRFAFRSTATVIELEVLRSRVVMTGVPSRPDGTVDLLVDGRLVQTVATSGGDVTRLDLSTGAAEHHSGPTATLRFSGLSPEAKHIEIWLPHYERTELVALRADAPITTAAVDRPVWVHHGSSISQGSNAGSPSTTWPALVATRAQVDLVNLGFSGSAMLDPFTARAMAGQPANLISVKIGINLVNADLMRQRAFGPAVHGFLDTLRDGHPTVPVVVIGPLYCPIHETTPGPGTFDTDALARGEVRFKATGSPDAPRTPPALRRLTLATIREQLAAVMSQRREDDPRITYVDGLELYGPTDAQTHPLPDDLHPDADTHRLIADRFSALMAGPGGWWA
ncbi:lipase [Mycobacterium sp. MS1601]|uniref:GDSL-type esterase/lipase family protein n=1 Tax=Mycobacterium sp. MS1601 TaxID=1936029 RepID=UPI00097924FB|nr:GDSL-type esterase/lipase family protein [Mycobacterium sp. MS1601]AQA04755.1 lipase [Mycobacterium sp. MS1601]